MRDFTAAQADDLYELITERQTPRLARVDLEPICPSTGIRCSPTPSSPRACSTGSSTPPTISTSTGAATGPTSAPADRPPRREPPASRTSHRNQLRDSVNETPVDYLIDHHWGDTVRVIARRDQPRHRLPTAARRPRGLNPARLLGHDITLIAHAQQRSQHHRSRRPSRASAATINGGPSDPPDSGRNRPPQPSPAGSRNVRASDASHDDKAAIYADVGIRLEYDPDPKIVAVEPPLRSCSAARVGGGLEPPPTCVDQALNVASTDLSVGSRPFGKLSDGPPSAQIGPVRPVACR